jgi:hypothetical protein
MLRPCNAQGYRLAVNERLSIPRSELFSFNEEIVDPAQAPALATAMTFSSGRTGAIVETNLAAIDQSVERFSAFIKSKTTHPRENAPAVVEEASQIRNCVGEANGTRGFFTPAGPASLKESAASVLSAARFPPPGALLLRPAAMATRDSCARII